MTDSRPSLRRRALLAFAALPALSRPGFAQTASWPSRPVRVVIPYPPGGGTDIMARIAAQHLTTRLGQTFVADNRAGANGQIAAEYVPRVTPDGYALFFCGNTQTAILPHLQPVNYDPAKDFVPVSIVGMNSAVFAVHPSVPANTLEEFVALVQARPGHYNFGSPGRGGGRGAVRRRSMALRRGAQPADAGSLPGFLRGAGRRRAARGDRRTFRARRRGAHSVIAPPFRH